MSATAKATATATAASAQAGGATIPAIKLEVTYTFNGDITGSWTERTWFLDQLAAAAHRTRTWT